MQTEPCEIFLIKCSFPSSIPFTDFEIGRSLLYVDKMFWIQLLLLSMLQSACATPTPHLDHLERENAFFTLKETKPILSKRDLNVTDNVFLLKEVGALTRSSRGKPCSLRNHRDRLINLPHSPTE